MLKIHRRQKVVNLLKTESLTRVNTTELERLALAYERSTSLNAFERSAVLRGIATELAERTTETKELWEGD